MKTTHVLTLAFVLLSYLGGAQCTLQGLQSVYCQSDTADSLIPSCTVGNPVISGDGVNSNNWFNPANADTGEIEIVVWGSYELDTSEAFGVITGSGTSVSLSDDAVSGGLNIGFPFRFYNIEYTQFRISSNGFITFDNTTANGCCSGQSIPDASTPNNLIANAWEDLYPPGGGTIEYFTTGTSPNQICVINFNNIQHYSSGNAVTSQIQLHEGCGRIEIHTTTMPSDGGNHTMGLEGPSGSVAHPYPGRNASNWSITNDVAVWETSCPDTFYTYVSAGPEVIVDADTVDCFGDSTGSATVSVNGTGPFTYLWDNGQTGTSATGLGSGLNTVTVTDGNGCSTFEDFIVASPQQITSNSNVTDANCSNSSDGEINMTYAGGVQPYSYNWSNGATSASITGLSAGSYTVTLTDANGCENIHTAAVDYDNEAPIVDLGDDKGICPGKVALLVVTPGYESYAWSNGGTGSSTVVSSAGQYTVTVTTADGCEGSDEIIVFEFIPDQVDLGPNVSGPAPITLDAGSDFTQFTWSTGATTQTITVQQSGTYSVIAADSNGCNSEDDVKVNIWPASVVELSEGSIAVFPNPTSNILNIMSASNMGDANLELLDITGRKVIEQQTTMGSGETIKLDVSNLPSGNYVLSISTERGLIKQNVMIE